MTLFRPTIALAGLMVVSLMSCGQTGEKKDAEADAGNAESAQPAIPGTIRESKLFKILVPQGWEFSSYEDGTVQTYNRSATYMVEVRQAGMNMTEKEIESLLASLSKRYNGTPLEKVEFLGLSFFKTTYTANSSHQTMFNAHKNGTKISIAMMGPDHETDPTIQAVFKSIVIK